MNEGRQTSSSQPKTFFEKLSNLLSGEPQNQADLLQLLSSAQQKGLLDTQAHNIIQGAIQVSDMHVREIMIPRSQAVILKADAQPKELLARIVDSAQASAGQFGSRIE